MIHETSPQEIQISPDYNQLTDKLGKIVLIKFHTSPRLYALLPKLPDSKKKTL